ncbi:hypothetical protein LXL04_013782 [Taraxacum kok-saghyz]
MIYVTDVYQVTLLFLGIEFSTDLISPFPFLYSRVYQAIIRGLYGELGQLQEELKISSNRTPLRDRERDTRWERGMNADGIDESGGGEIDGEQALRAGTTAALQSTDGSSPVSSYPSSVYRFRCCYSRRRSIVCVGGDRRQPWQLGLSAVCHCSYPLPHRSSLMSVPCFHFRLQPGRMGELYHYRWFDLPPPAITVLPSLTTDHRQRMTAG